MKNNGLIRPAKTSRVYVTILVLVSLCIGAMALVTMRGSVSAADAINQDRQRVWSAAVNPGTYEDNNANISYSGAWIRVSNSNASGGTYTYVDNQGSPLC